MKQKKYKHRNEASLKRTGAKIGVMLGLITALVLASAGPYPQLVTDDDGMSWHLIWEGNFVEAAEANPGAGASGILEIFFINHSAGNDYSGENTSATLESWCDAHDLGYANADDFNTELAHSTDFDVVVRVRANKTHAWRTDKFFDTDVNVTWTSSDLSVSADTAMTRSATRNNTGDDYIWLNFYDDNSGSGFSLAKDETASITNIKLEAYY